MKPRLQKRNADGGFNRAYKNEMQTAVETAPTKTKMQTAVETAPTKTKMQTAVETAPTKTKSASAD